MNLLRVNDNIFFFANRIVLNSYENVALNGYWIERDFVALNIQIHVRMSLTDSEKCHKNENNRNDNDLGNIEPVETFYDDINFYTNMNTSINILMIMEYVQ